MKLKVTVNGIAYSVDVEVEEEQRKLGSIITGGGPPPLRPPPAWRACPPMLLWLR